MEKKPKKVSPELTPDEELRITYLLETGKAHKIGGKMTKAFKIYALKYYYMRRKLGLSNAENNEKEKTKKEKANSNSKTKKKT